MSANPFDSFDENINHNINESDHESIDNDELYSFGDKHQNTEFEYYDIKVINFKRIIKPYNGNRIINPDRVKNFVDKYTLKPFFIPPLIVYKINDDNKDIHDYVLLDGQHRYEALKVLHNKNIKPIFSYILLSGTLDQAKEEFKNINSNVTFDFDDLCSYEKPADLITKIVKYFSNFVSKSDSPQSHKFNPIQLKEQLIKKEFFKKISNSVENIFNEILILNEKTRNEYANKQLSQKVKKHFDKINSQSGNKMFLLLDKDWLIKLIAKLEK
jgi:hypothetical protein